MVFMAVRSRARNGASKGVERAFRHRLYRKIKTERELLAGEPDFDRVIRLQNPIAPRSHGPQVGVYVQDVFLDGEVCAEHPLLGARVDFLGNPKFESRNYITREGSMGPIHPFQIEIATGGISLRREDVLYPGDPTLHLYQIPRPLQARRVSLIPMTVDRIKIAAATGITDSLAYRKRRQDLLKGDLQQTIDPVQQAALKKRIRELDITDPNKLQVFSLSLYNDYRFGINGPAEVLDPSRRLRGSIDISQDWPIVFWMGAWDTDALCGYIQGMLSLPFVSDRT